MVPTYGARSDCVAPSLPATADALFFRAAARQALQPDHPLQLRVDCLTPLLPGPLPACCVPNAALSDILRDSVSALDEDVMPLLFRLPTFLPGPGAGPLPPNTLTLSLPM
jgi:hypothetical protein